MKFTIVASIPAGGRSQTSKYKDDLTEFAGTAEGTVAQVPFEDGDTAQKVVGKLKRAIKGLNLAVKVKTAQGNVFLVNETKAAADGKKGAPASA